MAGPTSGREAKSYYNTGTFASPTWTLIPQAIDVNWTIGTSRADVSSRASLWKMERKGLQSLEATFGYRRRQGVSDSVFTALHGHARADTKVELALADAAIATTGTQYLRATYQLEMSRDEPLEAGAADGFTAFLTYEEDTGTMREPTWTVV